MLRKKIRFLGLVLSIAAMAAFLTACGDDDDNGYGIPGGAGGAGDDGDTGVTLAVVATVNVGNTLALTAMITGADQPLNLTWASSNPAVATVSNDGVITGVSEGTVTITARTDCGIIADIEVRVVQPGVIIYTVTFDSGGGSFVPAASVASGATFAAPANPTRPGFAFLGWYKESTHITLWDFAAYTVTGNITLFARWVQTFTVTFVSNGGSAVSEQTVETGTAFTEPAAPTRANYIFRGWYTEAAHTTRWNFTTLPTADRTLYARWFRQIQMVYIQSTIAAPELPNNWFYMGPPGTQRQVTLTHGFYMGIHQVTRDQWIEVMGNYEASPPWVASSSGSPPWPATRNNYPASRISWYNAIVFANRMSIMRGLTPVYQINAAPGIAGMTVAPGTPTTNPDYWGPVPPSPTLDARWNAVTIPNPAANGYRLPTEAQWEHAARAGTTTDFHNGINWVSNGITNPQVHPSIAWLTQPAHGSGGHPRLVTQGIPNAWGLFNMHGNVCEWVWDRSFVADGAAGVINNSGPFFTATDPDIDPSVVITNHSRIRRGGHFSASSENSLVWARFATTASGNPATNGFRLIRHP